MIPDGLFLISKRFGRVMRAGSSRPALMEYLTGDQPGLTRIISGFISYDGELEPYLQRLSQRIVKRSRFTVCHSPSRITSILTVCRQAQPVGVRLQAGPLAYIVQLLIDAGHSAR